MSAMHVRPAGAAEPGQNVAGLERAPAASSETEAVGPSPALPLRLEPNASSSFQGQLFAPPNAHTAGPVHVASERARQPVTSDTPSRGKPASQSSLPSQASASHERASAEDVEASDLAAGADADSVQGVTRGTTRVNGRTSLDRSETLRAADPGEFWARVVLAQRALQDHPQCSPAEAMNLAIAWAVAASGLDLAAARSGANKHGTAATASRAPAGAITQRGGAQPGAATSAPRFSDLPQWVNALHSDLSARAERALITAWEQRGSALRAATHGKG